MGSRSESFLNHSFMSLPNCCKQDLQQIDGRSILAQQRIGAGGIVAGEVVVRIDRQGPRQPFLRPVAFAERRQRDGAHAAQAWSFPDAAGAPPRLASLRAAHISPLRRGARGTERPAEEKRRLIVVGLNLHRAQVVLRGPLEVAFGDAELGIELIGLIAIGIERERLLESGGRLGAAVGRSSRRSRARHALPPDWDRSPMPCRRSPEYRRPKSRRHAWN